MAVRVDKPAHAKGSSQRTIGPVAVIAERLLLVGALASLAAAAYLLFSLFSRQALYYPYQVGGDQLLEAGQKAHMASQLALAGQWLNLLLLFTTLAALVRFYDNGSAAWGFSALGAALYFGFPYLLGALLLQEHLAHNPITQAMVLQFGTTARSVLFISVTWLVIGTVVGLIRRPRTRQAAVTLHSEQAAARPSRSLMRNCWELTHCGSNTRGICPCYRTRKTCWKRGQGCFCDISLFERTTDGAGAIATMETQELHHQALSLRRGGRRPCTVCPVYEEHQFYKYRAVCWIAYPATVALMVLALPALTRIFSTSMVKLDRFVADLSLLPSKAPAAVFETTASNTQLQWFIIGCLTLLLLGYVLQFIEYLVFVKKL